MGPDKQVEVEVRTGADTLPNDPVLTQVTRVLATSQLLFTASNDALALLREGKPYSAMLRLLTGAGTVLMNAHRDAQRLQRLRSLHQRMRRDGDTPELRAALNAELDAL
jgi:hypothetical protein